MLTIISYDADSHTLYARYLDAHAASGNVLPGQATEEEIREYANEQLAAPDHGDFSDAAVEFTE